MARSLHRRKKSKQWQPPSHDRKPQKGAASIFAVLGAIVGLGITYFASDGKTILMIIGLLVGSAAGYYLGSRFDMGGSKK